MSDGTMKCGHPPELLVKAAETGEPLYCELCDTRKRASDAECMEQEYGKKLRGLRRAIKEYPERNTHQLQASKVCAGILRLAKELE